MSPTHELKFEAPGGKQRIADVLNSDGVILLAKHYPNTRAAKFLDWFIYVTKKADIAESTLNVIASQQYFRRR